jgi:hypothetical protein
MAGKRHNRIKLIFRDPASKAGSGATEKYAQQEDLKLVVIDLARMLARKAASLEIVQPPSASNDATGAVGVHPVHQNRRKAG